MKAAIIKMGCGHTNRYASPWPSEGELAWCHRCQEFKGVAHARQNNIEDENTTGYNKRSDITRCYYDDPRWYP